MKVTPNKRPRIPRDAHECTKNLKENLIKIKEVATPKRSKMIPKTVTFDTLDLLWEPVGLKTSTFVKICDPKVSPEAPFWDPWPPKEAHNSQKYTKSDV